MGPEDIVKWLLTEKWARRRTEHDPKADAETLGLSEGRPRSETQKRVYI